MITDYNIIVEKWYFEDNSEIQNCNWFSDTPPKYSTQLLLDNYLIDIGTINNNYTTTRQKEYGILEFESSNFSIKLSDIDNICGNFFELRNIKSYLYKFVIKIYEGNQLRYTGLVSNESLLEPFNLMPDSNILELTIIGFDKEFKDYFSNKALPGGDDITWLGNQNVSYLLFYNGGLNIEFLKYQTFNSILQQIFPSVQFSLDTEIQNYNVVYKPFLKGLDGGNFLLFKSGYENFTRAGYSRYDYLKGICLCMGWDLFYNNGIFHIKERGRNFSIFGTLDYNDILEYTLAKTTISNDTYRNIAIIDGRFDFGSDWVARLKFASAVRLHIINENEPINNNVIPFNKVINNNIAVNGSHSFIQFDGEDNNNLSYKNYNIIPPSISFSEELKNLKVSETIKIDTGDAWNYVIGYSQNGYNFYYTGTLQDNELVFSGNPANSLFKTEGSNIITYDDYVKSDRFKRNFEKFLYTKNNPNIINLKINKIIWDIPTGYMIVYSPDINGYYGLLSNSIDLKNEITEMELIRI